MILTRLQRPLQACVPHLASPTDLLGLFYLEEGWTRIANWEKQLRVLIQTGGLMAPIHGVTLLTGCSGSLHKDPAVLGKPRVLYTDLDSRSPRLSSIETQYKTFERSVPHISFQLWACGGLVNRFYPLLTAQNTLP
jgi:hypothetical protein